MHELTDHRPWMGQRRELSPEARATKALIERLQYRIPQRVGHWSIEEAHHGFAS